MKKRSYAVVVLLIFVALGNAHAAEEANKDDILRLMAAGLVDGICSTVMQQSYATTMGSTQSDYLADNDKLHQCQYLQEQIALGCAKAKNCRTYEAWSKANPEFYPSMPRPLFVAKLDARRRVVAALRAVGSN